jgi:hypothetical protein
MPYSSTNEIKPIHPAMAFTQQPLNLNPEIGERWVTVRRQDNGKWVVHVQEFKANKLRGDQYWETIIFRRYAKKADAERYAARF